MKQSFRIGFIGGGKQAQSAHLRHYATIPEFQLAALADVDVDLAKRVAARHGVARATDDYRELLRRDAVDAIVMTLPPMPTGERIIGDVLKAGIPLFVEKPLAASPVAAERIVRAARESGSLFRVGFHKRSDPATMAGKAIIETFKRSGEVGRMTYIRIQVSLAGDWIANGYRDALPGTVVPKSAAVPPDEFPGMDEPARKRAADFAITQGHQFDWMRHLAGEPYRLTYADPTGVLLVGRTLGGVPVAFEFTPFRSSKDWVENALVAFEDGYVRIALPPPLAIHLPGTLEVFRDGGKDGQASRTSPVFPRECAMHRQALNFLAELRGEASPLCDALQAQESLEAARQWSLLLP